MLSWEIIDFPGMRNEYFGKVRFVLHAIAEKIVPSLKTDNNWKTPRHSSKNASSRKWSISNLESSRKLATFPKEKKVIPFVANNNSLFSKSIISPFLKSKSEKTKHGHMLDREKYFARNTTSSQRKRSCAANQLDSLLACAEWSHGAWKHET